MLVEPTAVEVNRIDRQARQLLVGGPIEDFEEPVSLHGGGQVTVIIEGGQLATAKPTSGPLQPPMPAVAVRMADFALVVRTHLADASRAQEDFVVAGSDEYRCHVALIASGHHLGDQIGVLVRREEVGHAKVSNIDTPRWLLADDPDVTQVEEVLLQRAETEPQFVIAPAAAATERDDDVGLHDDSPHYEEESSGQPSALLDEELLSSPGQGDGSSDGPSLKEWLSPDESLAALPSLDDSPEDSLHESLSLSESPVELSPALEDSLLPDGSLNDSLEERLDELSDEESSLLDELLLSSPGGTDGSLDDPSLSEGLSLDDSPLESSPLDESLLELSLVLGDVLLLDESLDESSDDDSPGDDELLSEDSLGESLVLGESLSDVLEESSGEELPELPLLSSLDESSLLLLSELSSQQMY